MTVEERLAALEKRLHDVEDQLAITDLIYRYGPAIDTGSVDDVLALFTDDGVYDVDTGILSGADEIAAMVTGDMHQGLIRRGCGHVMSAPQIRVEGDEATVVSYSQLVLRNANSKDYSVLRTTVNYWQLVRTDDGWRIAHRTARKADGTAEVRALLGSHSAASLAARESDSGRDD
ncbi:nuclear transport factor 2 family protein [Gordonia sp. (in: high G+C Gram-positive bacteria)]|uniref:nuclear transport factor 2 family protein n=1 Tax=Gordonia sp. (in: high G+C Gram-positive bacteria) TaxID=84139 RepID=UPI0016B1E105|nr:nuclear transport factor 2 family protein [Gordonia sp. (in: high G+C Gram-positive bacteria)]NLG46903.1 SnoaL-like domain-containing protein [Gordonia sp. (in: high G+C Gram-positive bacteria)]